MLKCARLALEGHLAGRLPVPVLVDAGDEPLELLVTEIGRRAAAEVDELELAPPQPLVSRIQRDLTRQGGEIALDLVGVLVGVDAEVAEPAALAAKRDVQV